MEKPRLRPDHRRGLALAAPIDPTGDSPARGPSEAAAGRVLGRGVLLLVAAVVGVVLSAQLGSVFLRLFVAAILAAAMTPPVDAAVALLGRWRWAPPRAGVAAALYLLAVVLAAVLAALVLGPVVAESRAFVERLPGHVEAAADWYRRTAEAPGPPGELLRGAGLGQPLGALVQQAPDVANRALYLTVDGARIRDYLVVFVPFERRETAVRLSGEVARRLGGWARGQVLLCAIIGGMSWLGLTALGVPYALMLAVVAGAMEAVPTVGPILSAVPAVGVALTVSPWHGAAVVVLYTVIQQLENYLVVPRVMVGAELLGPSGTVLSVPIAATLAVLVDELRRGRLRSAEPGA